MRQTELMTPNDLHELSFVRGLCSSGEARTIRVTADVGLTEISDAIGVRSQTVWRWENQRRTPTGPPALRYAALMRVLAKETSAR